MLDTTESTPYPAREWIVIALASFGHTLCHIAELAFAAGRPQVAERIIGEAWERAPHPALGRLFLGAMAMPHRQERHAGPILKPWFGDEGSFPANGRVGDGVTRRGPSAGWPAMPSSCARARLCGFPGELLEDGEYQRTGGNGLRQCG